MDVEQNGYIRNNKKSTRGRLEELKERTHKSHGRETPLTPPAFKGLAGFY